MIKSFIAVLIFSISTVAYSAVPVAVKQLPKDVHMFTTGVFVFYADVTEGDQIANCSGNNRWAINASSTGAKEIISMVIAAKVAGQTITVVGTGNCNPNGGSGYGISHLYLK